MVSNKRVPIHQVVDAAPIVIDEKDPDLIFLSPKKVIITKNGKAVYDKYSNGIPGGGDLGGGNNNDDGTIVVGPDLPKEEESQFDIPDLTDIEGIVYEQYYDAATKAPRYKAIITIRNSSSRSSEVQGVDARLFNPQLESFIVTPETPATPAAPFIIPTPSVPLVVFSRSGSSMAWGWNNSGNLGSYSSVSYEWKISTTSSPSATAIDSGTETFSTTSSFKIGTISNNRRYRVSSGDGDTSATTSFRWLRARTVVIGTDGNTYSSAWSTPV
jgi:hypothetical protein